MSAPLDDLMGNALTEPIVMETEEEIEVSVLDDRPEADQKRPKVDELDPDDEIGYRGAGADKRIRKLRYEYHEERRAKEASDRMREEAVTHAQRLASENNDLKGLLQRGEKVLLSEIKSRTEVDLNKAREDYKRAYEAGDTDAILKAQESLNHSQLETERANHYLPDLAEKTWQQQEQETVVNNPPQQVDVKLQSWLKKNDWFGKDEEMTSFAYGVHEKLVRREGVDPRSDEYYARIDDRMRNVFPGKLETDSGDEEPSASPQASTVVAPATRSSGKPRKVQLTSTQVALAKRLGITPQQYAKQLLKEISNG